MNDDPGRTTASRARAAQGARRVARILVACLAACVAACASSPDARFFVLRPIEGDAPDAASADAGESVRADDPDEGATGIKVRVMNVEVPRYLERPQIVTRAGAQELHSDEFARWAEPLPQMLTRVLVENLSTLLDSQRIRADGPVSEPPDAVLQVEVTRLDASPGESVSLHARIRVMYLPRPDHTHTSFNHEAPWGDSDPAGLAAATQQAVDALSRAVADALRAGVPTP